MAELSRLPGRNTDLWDWQLRAACRELGDDLFFHPVNERMGKRRRREQAAKAVCTSCPVVDACRAHALAVREPYGVWGGLTVEEREALLRSRAVPRGVAV